MLAYLNGILAHKQEGMAIIDCNGVGYELFVSNNTLMSLPFVNEPCKLYSYMQVKDDGIALFGFSTVEERDLFNKLISVSGVGPKGALAILSGMSLSDLLKAIASEDVAFLSKIKGLGKKTAERLCLELKDKINIVGFVNENTDYNPTAVGEAIEVLVSLGISKNDANNLAKSVAKQDMTVEQIIAICLQTMGR